MLSTDTQVAASTLPTLMHDTVSISANDKPVVLYFFAPWCEICHMSIGNLQSIYEKNDNIDVIAIALDFTDQSEVERFTRRHQLTFPVALGNEQLKKQYKIEGYPSYYVSK